MVSSKAIVLCDKTFEYKQLIDDYAIFPSFGRRKKGNRTTI